MNLVAIQDVVRTLQLLISYLGLHTGLCTFKSLLQLVSVPGDGAEGVSTLVLFIVWSNAKIFYKCMVYPIQQITSCNKAMQ